MCGLLYAVVKSDNDTVYVENPVELLEFETRVLRHRGPDQYNYVIFGQASKKQIETVGPVVGLAHTRLAVVNPEHNDRQPIIYNSESKCVCVAINGEIYNHEQIRSTALTAATKQLSSKFQGGGTDCDVVLSLYLQSLTEFDNCPLLQRQPKEQKQFYSQDTRLPTMLDGPFAFVLIHYDALDSSSSQTTRYAQNTVIIARDRMGINPLYVLRDPMSGLIYAAASEMKALNIPIGIDSKQWIPTNAGTDDNLWVYPDTLASWSTLTLEEFPPGHVYVQKFSYVLETPSFTMTKYFDIENPVASKPIASIFTNLKIHEDSKHAILRQVLHAAVDKRIAAHCCTAPYGLLLSGGLDSSIVAAIARRIVPADKQIKSFSIGLPGSPDIRSATAVAHALGLDHTNFYFTIDEGIAAIEQVIWHIETYDITTIRASVPMFLLAKKIREHSPNIKMVLSGEGADELFGGYLYFHHAPNPAELELEVYDKLNKLHAYDLLRANKSMAAFGIEVRVPFLDNDVIAVATKIIKPEDKMIGSCWGNPMEKFVLREAFKNPIYKLPKDILYRQKEQFSDGVGYAWIDSIREYAARVLGVNQSSAASVNQLGSSSADEVRQPKISSAYNCSEIPEARYYRYLFDCLFTRPDAPYVVPKGTHSSIACSTPNAVKWMLAKEQPKHPFTSGGASESGKTQNEPTYIPLDPSGRAVIGVHVSIQ